jgi:uncharacterized hydrophobic protein (TIGR00271 family)
MSLLQNFIKYIDLRHEVEDQDYIHQVIDAGVVFRGTNLWILVFAIVVASVGLNTNSTAVIIGAMLISPLMGPINGIGYSIATYDFLLLKKAIKNFGFAVIASLFASTAYFFISPVSTAHSELLARTSPNIYDVLIALFGGLAGIVAISSKQKGNVIPGVAIATALMPPLCTAGYGLATKQFNFFFGAFYLFTINTVFIAFASLVVCQALKFPIRTIVNEAKRKRVNQIISTVIVITLLPSIYFGYVLVVKEKFKKQAEDFTNAASYIDGYYLLKKEINADKRSIMLIYSGNSLSNITRNHILKLASRYNLPTNSITILDNYNTDLNNALAEQNTINVLRKTIEQNKNTIDSLLALNEQGRFLLPELKALYPWVISVTHSKTYKYFTNNQSSVVDLIVIESENKNISQEEREKIKMWLSVRLRSKQIQVWFKQQEIN